MTKIATIDVDHIFYLSLTGKKLLDINGEPIKVDNKFTYRERTFEESCVIVDNYITNILNVTETTHYIGFFSGSSLSRKYINPDYKANRKDLEPLKNLDLMKNHLISKWKFIKVCPGYSFVDETDDYVASFVKQVANSFIVSPDKDLLGLKGTHYNPKQNVWVTTTKEQEEMLFWKSMVCGDTADNIKGLPGKGEKAFEQCNQFISPTNSNILGVMIFDEYVKHYKYNYELVLDEFYKNYKCLKLVTDLDISMFTPIEWKPEIISDLEFDIN
jgi:5'-3' exonuclease